MCEEQRDRRERESEFTNERRAIDLEARCVDERKGNGRMGGEREELGSGRTVSQSESPAVVRSVTMGHP